MKYFFPILISLVFSSIAYPQEINYSFDLKEVLKQSRKAIKSLHSACYRANYRKDDEREEQAITFDGYVCFEKIKDPVHDLGMKASIDLKWYAEQDTLAGTIKYDGDVERSVYHNSQKVYIYDRAAFLTGNIVGNIVDTILSSDNPYENVIARMDSVKYRGTQKVSGESCHVFTLYYPDNKYLTNINTTWYLSLEDHLPRKTIRKILFNGKKRVTTFEISDLKSNPILSDSIFTISSFPVGYEIERPKDRAKNKKPELLEAGIEAPNWTLKNGDDEEISLSDYRDQIIILDFWGTWCPPCWKAMPELQKIHESNENITVLGVSVNEPENAEPQKFARGRDITYPILLNGEEVASTYDVRSFPTFYIINKKGKIVYSAAGYGEGTGKKIKEVLNIE